MQLNVDDNCKLAASAIFSQATAQLPGCLCVKVAELQAFLLERDTSEILFEIQDSFGVNTLHCSRAMNIAKSVLTRDRGE